MLVAKPYILHAENVTIYSWDYKYPYHSQKMDISIKNFQTCRNIVNTPLSRNFVKDRQMCGIPSMPNQRVTPVIKSISQLTFITFCP